ncbi:hypothetical protein FSW04_07710 [Baekduia soli]|uniref:HTH iclR-type domain-containing protein n=1 Tax=Baekduia soli TaxID=496014 RepID=A0A5B8U369_9ACTN|nr:hypothetical protein [Baekduia soli]QEC47476.1 hypothetical protein FSW04_07710 [Baekduia soli]
MNDHGDPFRTVACELLCVLADEGRPMSLRDLEDSDRLGRAAATRQLSVARVAGFVRTVPCPEHPLEPTYRPTTLGLMIARRSSRAAAAAGGLRDAADATWAAA